nr:hypothetical protein [uncultured Rhodopila sp.]
MRLDTSGRLPRRLFTETGIADPGKFAHVRQQLGIDPVPKTEAPCA